MRMSRTTKQKGDDYENFVSRIYSSIKEIEKVGLIKCSRIERHKKVPAKYGTPREIDLYWEYEMEGKLKKTAIECKGYKSRVTIEKLDAFHTKLQDTGIDNGIFCALSGYQSGAIDSAKYHNITVLELREPREEDWHGTMSKLTLTTKITSPIVLDVHAEFVASASEEKGRNEKVLLLDDNIYSPEGTIETTLDEILRKHVSTHRELGEQKIEQFFTNSYMKIWGRTMQLKRICIKYKLSTSTYTTVLSKVANAFLKHFGVGEFLIFEDGSVRKMMDTRESE